MISYEWWSFIFLYYILNHFCRDKYGQHKLFEKAGEAGWKAWVPVYGNLTMLQLNGKPNWWVAILYIPIVGILVWVSMMIDFARAFGKYKLWQHAAALLAPFVYFPVMATDANTAYLGPPETHKNVPKKSSLREWGDAFLFAGVAALIIRTFFIEAFMIPTSSMERTLLAGDFLFVSKFHYGSRMPMVPTSVPFLHNKISLGKNSNGTPRTFPSYLDIVRLPYYRFPGLTKVNRNDIVVFNYPAHDIHDLGDGAGLVEPISMKENYIKRCVAMPGDTFEIRDRQIYINGKIGENPPGMQFSYQGLGEADKPFAKIVDKGGYREYSFKGMEEMGFRKYLRGPRNSTSSPNSNWVPFQHPSNTYMFFATNKLVEELEAKPEIKSMTVLSKGAGEYDEATFPTSKNNKSKKIKTHNFKHNPDNYNRIVIPKKGMTIPLSTSNLILYQRCIKSYEGHDIKSDGNDIYIDGEKATSYTFEMDYYFMMGDNRHNSEDSRYWGFVPETHIVGKPLFVFFSYEKDFGIRWSRIGTKYVK